MACWDLWQLEGELGLPKNDWLPEPEGRSQRTHRRPLPETHLRLSSKTARRADGLVPERRLGVPRTLGRNCAGHRPDGPFRALLLLQADAILVGATTTRVGVTRPAGAHLPVSQHALSVDQQRRAAGRRILAAICEL